MIEVSDPLHSLMTQEIFGPILSIWVYDDDRFEHALELCDTTGGYGLTGAVFANDEGRHLPRDRKAPLWPPAISTSTTSQPAPSSDNNLSVVEGFRGPMTRRGAR